MARIPGRYLPAAALAATLAACSTNPVTGKSELMLVGEGTELSIGEKNYAPMRQSEGGDYSLDPALTSYVQRVGNRLAAVSDRKLPYQFVVLNNTIPNAWALPGGKIAVNRGLLVQLKSESELAAVLGHEIVHAAARHSAQQMSKGMLLQGGLLAAQVASSDSDYGNLYMAGAGLGAQLLMQRYSREAELEADKYGIEYMSKAGYNVQGAVTLQETFVRMSANKDSNWFEGLFASHPPSQERVDANRKHAAQYPAGGEMGTEAYAAAIAPTLKSKPAYDAYEEGRKALKDKRADVALAKADQAIKLAPDEGHFYALRGDAYLVQKKLPSATQAYTDAIARNDQFFYYYLQRGLIAEHERQDAKARSDLETSVKLLPTGAAYYALGNIASRARNPGCRTPVLRGGRGFGRGDRAGGEPRADAARVAAESRQVHPRTGRPRPARHARRRDRQSDARARGGPFDRRPVRRCTGPLARHAPGLQRHAGGRTASTGCDGSWPVPEFRPVQGRNRLPHRLRSDQ